MKSFTEQELATLLTHANQSEVMHAVRFILSRASEGAKADAFHSMSMDAGERAWVCGRGAMAESLLAEFAQYVEQVEH